MNARKSVLVTGAARGMGAAHAVLLAERGYHLHVADLAPVDETLEAIARVGGTAQGHLFDVASWEAWERLAAELSAITGSRLWGLVNNAGVAERAGILDTTLEAWHRVMQINLDSVFYGMKAIAPVLITHGGGSIVNISSAGAMTGYHSASYGASKWAVRGLTKTGAAEFAKAGVRVNSVHPGLIDTPMVADIPDFVASHLRSIPAGRAGRPDEVSRLIAFLLSDDSEYVTGTEQVVDGGLLSNGIYYRIRADIVPGSSAP